MQRSVVAQQFVRVVADLFADMRVFAVQVPVACLQLFDAYLPGEFVLHPCGKAIGLVAPPGFFHCEFFDAHWASLGVVLHASRVLVFVEPHVFSGRPLGEK
ncbi:hypothetical protein D3C77_685880 [compost metagenome]